MRFYLCLFFLVFSLFSFSQKTDETSAVEVNFLRGNVMAHSPVLHQLITGHPEGVMVSFSKKTHGREAWQKLYNYPDYGAYFLHQDFKNEILGKAYAIGAHYNFYFLNRNLVFKIGNGVAMTTNPYDKVTNSKNKAFGSRYMGNVNLMVNLKKEHLLEGIGFEAGFFFTHYSSGRIKSPNSGINTYGVHVGLNYNLDKTPFKIQDTIASSLKFTEPIRYNIVLRTGVNESQTIGSGQKPFYHIGLFADKRLNRKSAVQFGTDIFLTTSLKEYIRYRAIAFPEDGFKENTDYKRVGLFIGHELFVNRISIETQLGYYIYRKYDLDIPIYNRLGLKYYWSKNIYSGLAVKTHGFMAEALEFSLGVRL